VHPRQRIKSPVSTRLKYKTKYCVNLIDNSMSNFQASPKENQTLTSVSVNLHKYKEVKQEVNKGSGYVTAGGAEIGLSAARNHPDVRNLMASSSPENLNVKALHPLLPDPKLTSRMTTESESDQPGSDIGPNCMHGNDVLELHRKWTSRRYASTISQCDNGTHSEYSDIDESKRRNSNTAASILRKTVMHNSSNTYRLLQTGDTPGGCDTQTNFVQQLEEAMLRHLPKGSYVDRGVHDDGRLRDNRSLVGLSTHTRAISSFKTSSYPDSYLPATTLLRSFYENHECVVRSNVSVPAVFDYNFDIDAMSARYVITPPSSVSPDRKHAPLWIAAHSEIPVDQLRQYLSENHSPPFSYHAASMAFHSSCRHTPVYAKSSPSKNGNSTYCSQHENRVDVIRQQAYS